MNQPTRAIVVVSLVLASAWGAGGPPSARTDDAIRIEEQPAGNDFGRDRTGLAAVEIPDRDEVLARFGKWGSIQYADDSKRRVVSVTLPCTIATDTLWDAPHRKIPQPEWLHGLRKDLRAIPELRELRIESWAYSDDDLRFIAGIPQLVSLDFHDRGVGGCHNKEEFTGGGFRHLAGTPALRSLLLSWKDVESLRHLAQLPGLRCLSLWGEVIDDELKHLAKLDLHEFELRGYDLAYLSRMTDMRKLHIGARVDDAALRHLAGMKNLESLTLYGSPITDDGLRHLEGLVKLQSLTLPSRQVTGKGLPHLARLSELEHLNLNGALLVDDDLPKLSELPALRKLEIKGTGVTIAGLRAFRNARPEVELIFDHLRAFGFQGVLPPQGRMNLTLDDRLRIHELDLSPGGDGAVLETVLGHAETAHVESLLLRLSRPPSAENLSQLERLKLLRSLWLATGEYDGGKIRLEGDALACVGRIAALESLSIVNGEATIGDGANLERLSELTNLRELRLYGSPVTGENLRHLAKMSRLETLDLRGARLGNGDGLKHLAALTDLRELQLAGSPISSANVRHLAEMRRLEFLDLKESRIDDDALKLLEQLPALRKLDASDTRVSIAGLRAFRERRPEVELSFTAATAYRLHDTLRGAYAVLDDDWKIRALTCEVVADELVLHNIATAPMFADLEKLTFYHGYFLTARGCGHLAALPKLKHLHLQTSWDDRRVLGPSRIDGEGLARIGRLTQLESLTIRGGERGRLAEDDLRHFAGLTNLRLLDVNENGLSAEAIAEFRKRLPKIESFSSFPH